MKNAHVASDASHLYAYDTLPRYPSPCHGFETLDLWFVALSYPHFRVSSVSLSHQCAPSRVQRSLATTSVFPSILRLTYIQNSATPIIFSSTPFGLSWPPRLPGGVKVVDRL